MVSRSTIYCGNVRIRIQPCLQMATARGFVMHLSACLLKSWHRSHSLTAALASPSHFSHCCRLHQKLFVVRAHSAGQFNMTLCQSTRENLPMDVEPPAKLQRVEEVLKVKKLTEHAFLPKRGSAGAAGYDLASAYDCVVPARGKELVKTDLQISIPTGTYARVAPRSGLAWKNFIDTGAGVIDEDYRGNVGVLLFNHSDQDFNVKKGDRVAQLILERIATPAVVEVDDLEETNRGAGGFGSTGVSTAASS